MLSFKNKIEREAFLRNCADERRYNLILPKDEEYNPFDQHSGRTPNEFKAYNLTGQSINTIVDYMTKQREVI